MTSLSAPSFNLSNKKRALLIGNDNYKQWHSLQYCINNVNDLQVKLCGIHFQVTIGIDLICEEMDTMIETFVHTICPGDLVFFFFSGYGIHWNDQNFLIPIDDNHITAIETFQYQVVNVENTLNLIMARSPSTAIFLFDACRSYRMPHIPGLKISADFGGLTHMEPLSSSLIAFACEANKIAPERSPDRRHSLLASCLLEYIDGINLPIDEMMNLVCDDIMSRSNHQQCPFRVTSIQNNVYLNYQSLLGRFAID